MLILLNIAFTEILDREKMVQKGPSSCLYTGLVF